jgi:hypothetical protein
MITYEVFTTLNNWNQSNPKVMERWGIHSYCHLPDGKLSAIEKLLTTSLMSLFFSLAIQLPEEKEETQ